MGPFPALVTWLSFDLRWPGAVGEERLKRGALSGVKAAGSRGQLVLTAQVAASYLAMSRGQGRGP